MHESAAGTPTDRPDDSTDSSVLDLALRLWPQVRDHGTVADPADLDRLLATLGQPGAPGYRDGIRDTFACFGPGEVATLTFPTGEVAASDAAARFCAHVLVARVLVGAGLVIDERVARAMAMTYALSWTRRTGEHFGLTALEIAAVLWLVALDPDTSTDRPFAIDWSADCFNDESQWDPNYRLFSHYDIRERALDWAVWVSHDPERLTGTSVWTVIEPLLRMVDDDRAGLAMAQLRNAPDRAAAAPAAAMLERNRIANLLRAAQEGSPGLAAE